MKGACGKTYYRLNNIGQVVAHGHEEGAFLCVIGTDLVDPAENQWTGSILLETPSQQIIMLHASRGREPYTNIA